LFKENNKNRVSKSKEHEKETSREGIKNKKTITWRKLVVR